MRRRPHRASRPWFGDSRCRSDAVPATCPGAHALGPTRCVDQGEQGQVSGRGLHGCLRSSVAVPTSTHTGAVASNLALGRLHAQTELSIGVSRPDVGPIGAFARPHPARSGPLSPYEDVRPLQMSAQNGRRTSRMTAPTDSLVRESRPGVDHQCSSQPCDAAGGEAVTKLRSRSNTVGLLGDGRPVHELADGVHATGAQAVLGGSPGPFGRRV